jgi:hypothetical protein
VLAELPAQGAYLGLYARLGHNAADGELCANGNFETGLDGWTQDARWVSYIPVAPSGGPGGGCLRITGTGSINWPSSVYSAPVLPGATYSISAWMRAAGSGGTPARVRVDLYDPTDKINVIAGAANVQKPGTAGAWQSIGPLLFTVPANGSVGFAHILVYADAAPAPTTALWDFDAVSLFGPVPALTGFDALAIDWVSAG